jgi:HEPN domain-containing protein
MNSPIDHARALLGRARDDLYVVRRLRNAADAPVWVLGFHAQQCVEKTLKSVLSCHGIEYPRTHNLVMLVELLRRARFSDPPDADDLGQLVPFGVTLRYEDVMDDQPTGCTPSWLEGVATRVIDWGTCIVESAQASHPN